MRSTASLVDIGLFMRIFRTMYLNLSPNISNKKNNILMVTSIKLQVASCVLGYHTVSLPFPVTTNLLRIAKRATFPLLQNEKYYPANLYFRGRNLTVD